MNAVIQVTFQSHPSPSTTLTQFRLAKYFSPSRITSHLSQMREQDACCFLLQDSKSGAGTTQVLTQINAILLEISSGTSLGTKQGQGLQSGTPNRVSHWGFQIRILYHCTGQWQKLICSKFHYENRGIVYVGRASNKPSGFIELFLGHHRQGFSSPQA